MIAARVLFTLIFLAVAGYTSGVIWNHGIGLLPIFFGDMAALTWPGQFNLDFMCMLVLSGLWVSCRHRFRAHGILLGVCAFIFGALFLSGYLLVESFRTKGDIPSLLLGELARPSSSRST